VRAEAEDGIEPSRAGVAIRRLPIWQLGRVEETGRVELPGLEARPFSKRVCKTGMHVVSAEESGGIEPLTREVTPVFGTGYRPFSGTLRGRAAEGLNPAGRVWSPA
jgi:hypothetical protein